MRDYTKLDAFKLSNDLVLEVYRLTSQFPKFELYGLTSQIRRAIISVPSNIVEGNYRNSQKEYYNFLEIAFASLKESRYQMNLASRLNYLDLKGFQSCDEKFQRIEHVLFALVRSMKC